MKDRRPRRRSFIDPDLVLTDPGVTELFISDPDFVYRSRHHTGSVLIPHKEQLWCPPRSADREPSKCPSSPKTNPDNLTKINQLIAFGTKPAKLSIVFVLILIHRILMTKFATITVYQSKLVVERDLRLCLHCNDIIVGSLCNREVACSVSDR